MNKEEDDKKEKEDKKDKKDKKDLPVRELNPGHPRDRRVYWPLY